MRRLHCQLSADVMVKLYYYLVYSHLTYALLAWGRSGLTNAAKIECPNQKNIYGAALALIAIMYGSMQGIIAVASLLATMHNPGNGMDPQ